MTKTTRGKRKLLTAERLTETAQRGWWLARDWQGCPLVVRATKREALRDGLDFALRDARAANVDLSLFETEVQS